MFHTRDYISVSGSSHLDFNVTDFHCYLFSDSSMHYQSIDVFEISYEMLWHVLLVINKWCIRCILRLYRAIYEMLLTYKHVMLIINPWCIRCMIRFYHACNLYMLSNATECFYPWCIQCILAMLRPVDNFKVLRDVVLRDAWFTCYRSTLLTLYFIVLRYIPLIYVACSTCYQYTMILIKLGLYVTNMRMHVRDIAINN